MSFSLFLSVSIFTFLASSEHIYSNMLGSSSGLKNCCHCRRTVLITWLEWEGPTQPEDPKKAREPPWADVQAYFAKGQLSMVRFVRDWGMGLSVTSLLWFFWIRCYACFGVGRRREKQCAFWNSHSLSVGEVGGISCCVRKGSVSGWERGGSGKWFLTSGCKWVWEVWCGLARGFAFMSVKQGSSSWRGGEGRRLSFSSLGVLFGESTVISYL